MKKLTIALITMVVVLLSGATVYAKPTSNPNFPTREEVKQWIANATESFSDLIANLGKRLNLVETAVTANSAQIAGLNSRIDNLESQIPSPKPEPPFDLELIINETTIYVSGKYVRVGAITTNKEQRIPNPWYPSPVWHEPLGRVQYWGILHTPDGDVLSQVRYEAVATRNERGVLMFEMLNTYPGGTDITADVYAFYGGKIATKTVDINI